MTVVATRTFAYADIKQRWDSPWRITPLEIVAWLCDIGLLDVLEDGDQLAFYVTEEGVEVSRALRRAAGLDVEEVDGR